MNISRMMLATALFGALALPALAQPHVGTHQVRLPHHRIARHAPVQRVATGPEVKSPGIVAAAPKAAVAAAPLAATSGSAMAPATVPAAPAPSVPHTMAAGPKLSVPAAPMAGTAGSVTAPVTVPGSATLPGATGPAAPRVTTGPSLPSAARTN